MDNIQILNFLKEKKGTPEQIAFAKKIVNTPSVVYGLKTIDVKNLAKQIAKSNALEYLQNAELEIYEQKLLYGFVLGYAKLDLKTFENYLNKYFSILDCWALCDSPITTMSIIEKNKEHFFSVFVNNLSNKNPFVARFSVIAFFKFYLTDEYIDKVIDIYKNLKREEYYINIGLAWAICEILIKNYNKGVDLLQQKVLSSWVQNKAITKARESFRITPEQKKFLNTFKV